MKMAFLGGGGNMGSALIRGLLESGIAKPEDVLLCSSSPESTARDAERLGVTPASSADDAVVASQVVVLCVKPAKVRDLLAELSGVLAGKLIISLAAGILTSDLVVAAGQGCRVIRAMPNTAVRLRKGITALAFHDSATETDRDIAERIFAAVGTPVSIGEDEMDIVTAVSGSGPAFALLMIEAMARAAVNRGLAPDKAHRFAAGALSAAASLVSETGTAPADLRMAITSPGGTTAAGLAVLGEGGVPSIVERAILAAADRSAEMSGAKP